MAEPSPEKQEAAAPASPPALPKGAGRVSTGTLPAIGTPEAQTIRAPASPLLQTGVIPGRKVDSIAKTVRERPQDPPAPDSKTFRGSPTEPAGGQSDLFRRAFPEENKRADASASFGPGQVVLSAESDTLAGPGAPREGGAAEDRLGPYRIIVELGRGGMGVVYKAQHLKLRRDVALKVMLGSSQATEQDRSRFVREAEACAHLKHPHIVPVYDIQADPKGECYFAMEFIDGCSLLEWVRREKRSVSDIVAVMQKVCDAVAYAHQRGIIHRDLKPHNVMVDMKGEPKVMDFGLAKRLDARVPGAEKTIAGTVMGTPQYMPPEQASGRIEEVDTRSDVYALGAILYELFAGEPPLNATTLSQLLLMIETVDAPPLRAKAPGVPWEIEVIVGKALAKEKNARFQSAQAFADDLGRFLRKEPILARRPTLPYRTRKWVQRHPVCAAVMALLLAQSLPTGILLKRRGERQLTRAVAKATDGINGLSLKLVELEKRTSIGSEDEKAASAGLGEVNGAIKVAADLSPFDVRVTELRTKEKELEKRVDKLDEIARERAARDERTRQAALLVAQAERASQGIKPADLLSEKDAKKVARKVAQSLDSLSQARGALLVAMGLDMQNKDEARAHADAALAETVNALTRDVENAKDKLAKSAAYKEALLAGRSKLAAARALATEEDEDPGRDKDEVALALEDAAMQFERARTIDDAPEARRGYVDALLAEARSEVETAQDWKAAHRTATRIRALSKDDHDSFMTWLRAQEEHWSSLTSIVREAKDEKAAGRFGPAAARFDRALELWPDNAHLAFERTLCTALARGLEHRHFDELAKLDEADTLAQDPAERADVESARRVALAEMLKSADALRSSPQATDRDRDEAQALVDRVLKVAEIGPIAEEARRIRVDIAGRKKVARGTVFVSGGPFRYSVRPEEETNVEAFAIGDAEVTNREFAQFLEEGGYTLPAQRRHWPPGSEALLASFHGRDGEPGPAAWVGRRPLPGTDELPVTGVSWYEAMAYASFRHARLPSDVEWEKAAVYDAAARRILNPPWTPEQFEETWAPYFNRPEGPKAARAELPRSKPGPAVFDRSPCGAYDMYGNVHEWVADRLGDGACVRGGSFESRLPERSLPTRRFKVRPDLRAEHVGFRIATAAGE